MVVDLIREAVDSGARQWLACETVGLPERTFRRWNTADASGKSLEDGRILAGAARVPRNKLTEEERERIIEVCNSEEFGSLPPSQIVPRLADVDVYLGSVSSFYRILKEHKQLAHRGKSKVRRKVKKPTAYVATMPNQVWSWDITYLRTSVRGSFYYLYLMEDIFSRKIVGWEIHEDESAENASELITKACWSEKVKEGELVLHSDNGSPMKGSTMKARLEALGIVASFSRPATSNDNPYSESLFRTMKYCPRYPGKPFPSIEGAREWMQGFVYWYNNIHCHSGIRFVTPSQRHRGEDREILQKRTKLFEKAREKHPERWSGKIRDWSYIDKVELNPVKTDAVRKAAGENEELPEAA